MKSNIPLVICAAIFALILISKAHAASPGDAESFAQKAAAADKFEVQSSKLALSKSQNPDIKLFAQKMLNEQKQADDKLRSAVAAARLHTALATTPPDPQYKHLLDQLSGKIAEKDFDKLYVGSQQSAHKDSLALFQEYAGKGDNPALKSYAAATLPLLKKHQQMIDQIQVK